MKPQATPNYWWQNMLHKSSAAASACSLPSPPAGATPLWQIPFPASVLSPAQSQPVPISNPLASPLPLLVFFISFALFCHFSPISPLSPPPLSHSWSPKSSRLNLQNLPAAFAVSVSVCTSFFLFLLLLAYFLWLFLHYLPVKDY